MLVCSMENKQNIVFDTEFIQYRLDLADGRWVPVTELISIGMINDDGQEYYAVSSEFNLKAAQENRWVRENVLDKLPPEDTWISLRDMKPQIFDFVGKKPTKFNYYCIEEDMVMLRQIMTPTSVTGFPDEWDINGLNIQQEFERIGTPDGVKPIRPENIHNALEDARWAKEFLENIRNHPDSTYQAPTR